MKRIISLVFSLLIISGALQANAEYLSPAQYQERAQSECSGVSGTFLTNQSQACDDALAKCRAEYLQYLQGKCFSTTDFYGEEYLTCDAATLASAKQVAKSYHIMVGSACSLIQNDWPKIKPVLPHSAPIVGFYEGMPNPNVPHVDGEPLPAEPAPNTPEAPANSEGKPGTVDADSSATAQQFTGGGCSLQIAGAESFSSSLLVIAALIAVFSSYLFLRNRKK